MRYLFRAAVCYFALSTAALVLADEPDALALLRSTEQQSRNKGYEKIVDLRRHLVADLIALIEEKSTKQVPQDSVEKAMQLLGELRAPEAVPTLMKHLIYPLGFDPNDKSYPDVLIGGRFLNSTPRDLCPAVRSLISIGPVCTEAVIGHLRAANEGSVEILALIDVLKGLRSAAGLPDLQALLDASRSEKEKKNLRTAIRALGPCVSVAAARENSLNDSAIAQAVFSPDGKYLLTSLGAELELWELETGMVVRNFKGHFEQIHCVAFSPDGKRILSAAGKQTGMEGFPKDATARIWDVVAGVELQSFRGHAAMVRRAVFAPDGAHILTAGMDGAVFFWTAGNCTRIELFHDANPDRPERSLQISPSGDAALAIVAAGVVIRETTLGSLVAKLDADGHAFETAEFSPDGHCVITGRGDGAVQIWDAKTAEPIRTLSGHSKSVTAATYSADGKTIITGALDGTVRVWSAATGMEIRQIKQPGPVLRLSLSRAGDRVLTQAGDTESARNEALVLSLWNAATGKLVNQATIAKHPTEEAAMFSPDGRYVFVIGPESTEWWNADSGTQAVRFGTDDENEKRAGRVER